MNVKVQMDVPVAGISECSAMRQAVRDTLMQITTSGTSVKTVRYDIRTAFMHGEPARSLYLELDGVATPGLLCQLIDNIRVRMPVYVDNQDVRVMYDGDYSFDGILADWAPWLNWTTFGPIDWRA